MPAVSWLPIFRGELPKAEGGGVSVSMFILGFWDAQPHYCLPFTPAQSEMSLS